MNVDICDLAMPIPTYFDLFSFVFKYVISSILVIAFIIAFLLSKKKKDFLIKTVTNPISVLIIIGYLFLYPKTYIQDIKSESGTTMSCNCFGVESKVLGGNHACLRVQECMGIPYACQRTQ